MTTQHLIEPLTECSDVAMRSTGTVAALEPNCLASLSVPMGLDAMRQHITTYLLSWTAPLLRNHYACFNSIVDDELSNPGPFEWDLELRPARLSKLQGLDHVQRRT